MLYFIKILICICCMHTSLANKFIDGVDLYVLVSASMSKKAVRSLSYSSKEVDGAMLFKGLIDGNIRATNIYFKELVEKTSWGALFDPEMFDDFNVDQVPCFILAEIDITKQIKRYDKICGNVTLDYALSQFEEKGDMQSEAKILLNQLRGQGDINGT